MFRPHLVIYVIIEAGESRKPVIKTSSKIYKDGVLRLDEAPIAYGVYHGRLGVETERAIYVLDECPPSLIVQADGKEVKIDFGELVRLCHPK